MSRSCHPLAGLVLAAALAATVPASGLAAVGAPADTTTLVAHVRALADPALGGRAVGSPGARAAADSIAVWFAAAGLAPPAGGWFREFPLSSDPDDPARGRNVIGRLPGAGALADRAILVGAHFDHLGYRLSEDGSDTLGVYTGAEDNASGVAVLVALAGRLAADAAPERRAVYVAAFSGEEVGLLGSSALAADPLWSAESLDFMLNLDSVGRLRDDRLYVGGLGSSPSLRGLVEAANTGRGLALQLSDGGWGASDHVAFNAVGVPVLFFFTGPHPQYHTVDDTWDRVSYAGLARVLEFVADVALSARDRPEGFPYVDQPPSPDPADGRGRPRAWLGTIPDFIEGAGGVKMAGVMAGGPAEETGLRAGDVLVRLGEYEVAGLPDLAAALQSYGAGRVVEAEVLRDGKRMVFTVTLRTRPR